MTWLRVLWEVWERDILAGLVLVMFIALLVLVAVAVAN